MENASKALIIAGAILLAIVLVSLGVLVINNARKDIDNQNIDQATIDEFNSKISSYCGKSKSGTDMNNLIDTVSASNGAQTKRAEKHPIKISVTGIDSTLNGTYGYQLDSSKNLQQLSPTKGYPTFDNSMKYDANPKIGADGYIYQINITKAN